MGACSDTGTKFYFKDGYRSQIDHAYQVTRGDFDKVLLDHAAESGAEVHEETAVEGVEFSNHGVDLAVRSNGSANSIQARYLVDASGRTSVLGRQFKIKKTYDHLQKLSIFAHYDGVWRPEGIDGTLTVLIRAVDRWFWLIPLTDERTSVGVVLDSETFRKSKLSADDFLEQALAEQPTIAKRMTNAGAFRSSMSKRIFPIEARVCTAIAGCLQATPPDSSIRFLAAAFFLRCSAVKNAPTL